MKYRIKDRAVLGVLAGIAGSIVKNTLEELMLRKGWNNCTGAQMAAEVFLKKKDLKHPLSKFMGCLGNMGIGAGLGIPMVYFLNLTGKDFALLKGAAAGHLIWVYFYGGMNRIRRNSVFPLSPKSNFCAFFSHLAYGMTTAAVIKALGDEDIFRAKRILNKPGAVIAEKEKLVFRYQNGKYYLQH